MEQKQMQQINKEMVIQEIIAKHPDKSQLLSEIMMEFGIHCVGCGAAGFETLEEGVLGHGFTEKELEYLVNELNKAIKTKSGKKEKSIEVKDFKFSLTKSAVKKIKELMKSENKTNSYLRANVLAGGCSGYTYDLEIVDEMAKGDIQIIQDNIKILVNHESTEFLNGCVIDFVDTLNESGFKFNNPNSSKECGCGKSFS